MNRNRGAVTRSNPVAGFIGRLLLSAALVPAAHGQPSPQGADEPRPWPETETVRALLRADAAAALADCRVPGLCRPGPESVGQAPPPARASDDIRVMAIFGLARRLSADVAVNGAVLRYQTGRGEPVAGAVDGRAYQLLAIDDSCVRLRRGDTERTACVDAGRGRP
ncbi:MULTISPECIES: hypothetical protein [Achromobacter]|uniref:Uncharacterized protein n=1 Tax=Alcaligenes xylosoxydans xylosoxydans TaxID=85698 RepID=A0A424WBB7_ALCXX|nr:MULTISPECIES: hypothetical protein [Achromobacter]MBC9906391.1 hypothetical protein [Achromobacter xylosoxidans]MBD0870481.1 hypothetical protein [Achromobacter xylosoxidans]MDH1302923.1 hypothetical protein [Achromobacter sp. GD03932]QNP84028.1 hypothetical protein IAG39_21125 [Achromobacter xylosoxidans]RPJ90490.1 hypothetical protein DY367_17695 [Achromobacter xylosoxidans]